MTGELEPRGGRVREQRVVAVFVGGPADGQTAVMPDGRLEWLVPVREPISAALYDPTPTYRPMMVARYGQVFMDGLAVVDEQGRNVFRLEWIG